MSKERVTVRFILPNVGDPGLEVQLRKGKLIKQFTVDWTKDTPADQVLEVISKAWRNAIRVLETTLTLEEM